MLQFFLLLIHSTIAVPQRMEVDTVHQKFQSNAKDASTQTQLNVVDASTQTRKCMCICYSIYAVINTGLILFIEGGNCSVGAGVGGHAFQENIEVMTSATF